MINLLPPTARKHVTREYWLRVSIVWLALLLVVIIIIAVLQIPSYYLIRSQLSAYQTEYDNAKSQQEDFSDAETEVKTANELAKHAYNADIPLTASEVITTIKELAGAEVQLLQFTITNENNSANEIDIRGVASTRVALADFSKALIDHKYFSEANVPIENLANDQDLNFEITIVPEVIE